MFNYGQHVGVVLDDINAPQLMYPIQVLEDYPTGGNLPITFNEHDSHLTLNFANKITLLMGTKTLITIFVI